MDKRMLRRMAQQRLAQIDAFYIQVSDRSILHNLIELPEYKQARRIFVYYSMGKEVDTHRLIEGALRSGRQVYLPKTYGNGRMDFHEFREGETLVRGRMNIPEPDESAPGADPDAEDIIIVPGMVYDLEGYRLGYGGGYYDRYLAGRQAFSIGLCRDRMLIKVLPREEHDLPVDCLVTETKQARPE